MASLQEVTTVLAQNFSFIEGLGLAKPLGLFILGLAIYAWFIFKFYRFLAKRDMLKLNTEKFKGFSAFLHGVIYVVKYIIISPVFLLFWVLVLSVILAFLAKNTSVETILLVAVALIGVVRVTAYYDEDLSKDLAKMMPFALLGVFLVDVSYFSTSNSIETIWQLVSLWRLVVYYLVMLAVLEFVLRIFYLLIKPFRKDKEVNEKA